MGAIAKITTGAINVREELALLGLTPEILTGGMMFGERHRALCTDNDPRIFHGITAWARTISGLRSDELLRRDGWYKDSNGNFETIVNPDGSFAITVMTGDKETGRYDPEQPLRKPRVKHPKGVMLRNAIDMNLWLFADMAADAKSKADRMKAVQERTTWILLIHRDGDNLYAELSLPAKFDAKQVTEWKHRIILERLDLEPIVSIVDDSDDGDPAEIDVPVHRRT